MEKEKWEKYLLQVVMPILEDYSNCQLSQKLEPKVVPGNLDNAIVEAVSRSLMGISAWLENEEYSPQKAEARQIVKQVMINIGNREEGFNFSDHKQKLVEAGHLSYAMKMAPNTLFNCLSSDQKENLIEVIIESRTIVPHLNNWLLFSAVRESMLHKLGYDYNQFVIENAGLALNDWYIGDGVFKDGIYNAYDYYNSIVIQPLAYELLEEERFQAVFKHDPIKIFKRQMVHQERAISSTGEYAFHGRSLVYRCGVFHHLAKMSLESIIDETLSRSGIKNALSEVVKQYFENFSIFDEDGILIKGVVAKQESITEPYVSIGSLYMCSLIFLVLGIDKDDEFWTGNDSWTSKKIWLGQEACLDKKIH